MTAFDSAAFGERVKELRESRKMTQEHLAEKLNITLDDIKRLESGCKSLSVDLVITIADVLNISTDYLLMGEKTDLDEEREKILETADRFSELSGKSWNLAKKFRPEIIKGTFKIPRIKN